jgi:transcriptional antiterminator NusG
MTQSTPPAPAAPQVPAAPEVFKNRIFAVKTTSKQERTVADNILKAIDTKATDIKVASIIVPNELQGYVLIETPEQRNRIEQLVELIAHARVVTKGETSLAEVGHFLIPKPVVAGIDEGTIVELIAGPFKGEKAVVKRVDSEKITVELYESVVPIPITVRGDNVRVVEKFADR